MKVKELAAIVNGVVEGDGDADLTGLSGIESAKVGDLIFATDDEKLAFAEKTSAACVLTSKSVRPSTKPLLRVDNPKLAFLMIYNFMNKPVTRKAYMDPSATVAQSAKIGANVWIDAGVRIGDEVRIGDNTVIEANTVIKKNCVIGSSCFIHPNVTLYENTVLKDRVVLHGGVVLGADGFGYVRDKEKIYKFPQLGRVIIESDVEVGANSTIDRGSLSDTVVGAGAKIDNLCQIAHNVKTGKNFIMAAQTGISGSTIVKDNVTMAGQVGIADNLTIGNNVIVGAQGGVMTDIPDGAIFWGTPARPIMQTKREVIVLGWLAQNFIRIKKFFKEKT